MSSAYDPMLSFWQPWLRSEGEQPGGDWRIGQYEDTALIDDAEAVLRDLVAQSRAPALLGYVQDSDCVDLVAMGAGAGVWRSC